MQPKVPTIEIGMESALMSVLRAFREKIYDQGGEKGAKDECSLTAMRPVRMLAELSRMMEARLSRQDRFQPAQPGRNLVDDGDSVRSRLLANGEHDGPLPS